MVFIECLTFFGVINFTCMKKIRCSLLFLLFLCSITYYSFGQSRTIEGVVFDSKKKEPLAFATIGVKGTVVGTAANSEGRFILSSPLALEDSILFCSYMGYKNFEIRVRDVGYKENIGLKLDTFTLDEVEIRPWQPWDLE